MFTTKHKPTPLIQAACEHAEAVLAVAVQSIDNMMHEDGAAIEHSELIAGFMAVVAGAYQALTLRDGIDRFWIGKKKLAARARLRAVARWRDCRRSKRKTKTPQLAAAGFSEQIKEGA
jgi:hypothetical protein